MRKFWEFMAAGQPGGAGQLMLYGPIGSEEMSWAFDDVTPTDFKAELDALGDVAALDVYINSPGGDVFAGQAIHSMLQRHPAAVTVHVDGLAASIASIVAMAGDTVVMPRNAMMMVHNPWTGAVGDARYMRKTADTLDSIRESMVAVYQAKTGMDRPQLLNLLNAETWMTAQEAVDLGFADRVDEAQAVAASLAGPGLLTINGLDVDLGRYRNAPAFAELRDAAPGGPQRTERDAERALRDAGFSRQLAKAIVAGGWPAAAPPPAPPPAIDVEALVAIREGIDRYRW